MMKTHAILPKLRKQLLGIFALPLILLLALSVQHKALAISLKSPVAPFVTIDYDYQKDVTPGHIRYISQNHPIYNYWKGISSKVECTTSCISMALSYVGLNFTPYDCLINHPKPEGGYSTSAIWPEYTTAVGNELIKCSNQNEIATAVDRYIHGKGRYSPVFIYYNSNNTNSKNDDGGSRHMILIIGKTPDGEYVVLDPVRNNEYYTIKIENDAVTSQFWCGQNGYVDNMPPLKLRYDLYGGTFVGQYYRPSAPEWSYCNHPSRNELDLCTVCGEGVNYHTTSITSANGTWNPNYTEINAIYESVVDSVIIREQPYNTGKEKARISPMGTMFYVRYSFTNGVNKLWYAVDFDNGTYYIYSERLKKSNIQSDIQYVGETEYVYNSPSEVHVNGTIKSKYDIEKIDCYDLRDNALVTTLTGGKYKDGVYTCIGFYGSQFDKDYLKRNTFTAGNRYGIRFVAKDVMGGVKEFTVYLSLSGGGQQTPGNQTVPSGFRFDGNRSITLSKPTSYDITGTVWSSNKIKYVDAYRADKDMQNYYAHVTTGFGNNGTSLNIANTAINSAYACSQLAPNSTNTIAIVVCDIYNQFERFDITITVGNGGAPVSGETNISFSGSTYVNLYRNTSHNFTGVITSENPIAYVDGYNLDVSGERYYAHIDGNGRKTIDIARSAIDMNYACSTLQPNTTHILRIVVGDTAGGIRSFDITVSVDDGSKRDPVISTRSVYGGKYVVVTRQSYNGSYAYRLTGTDKWYYSSEAEDDDQLLVNWPTTFSVDRYSAWADEVYTGVSTVGSFTVLKTETPLYAEEESVDGKTVTLTAANHKSKIFYSYDGETYVEYSGPIRFTKDATLYYKAADLGSAFSDVITKKVTLRELDTPEFITANLKSFYVQGEEIILTWNSVDFAKYYDVSVTDFGGKEVYFGHLFQNATTVKLDEEGVYYFTIRSGNDVIQSKYSEPITLLIMEKAKEGWSTWSTEKPTDLPEYIHVEEKTQYRGRTNEQDIVSNTTGIAPEGYTEIAKNTITAGYSTVTFYRYAKWIKGPWSAWGDEKLTANEDGSYDVETRTLYRYELAHEHEEQCGAKLLSIDADILSDDGVGLTVVVQNCLEFMENSSATPCLSVQIGDKEATEVSGLWDYANERRNVTYRFKVKIPEMEQPIHLSVAGALGEAVLVDGITYADLLRAILADDSKAEMHEAVKSLLNLGGYSQVFFDQDTDTLSNESLYTEETDPVNTEDFSEITAEPNQYIQDKADSVEYIGMSLVIEDSLRIHAYFKADETHEYSVAVTTVDGDVLTEDAGIIENSILKVAVPNISRMDIRTAYHVWVMDNTSGTHIVVEVSPLLYMQKAMQSEDENLKNVVKALYIDGVRPH